MLEPNSDIDKLSPGPSNSWAELVLFSADPTTQPPTWESFLWALANLLSIVDHSRHPHHKLANCQLKLVLA